MGTAVDTLTYSYGNSTWGDLLTKVHSYTYYDAVGNPLNNDQRAYQWQHGRQLAKLAISSEFAIVSHPEDAACFASDRATFTVTAAGTGLTYQWQYKNGENWLDHTGEDATTSTISVDAAGNNGTAYRCVVTNADGALLVSKPATLKHTTIRITSLSPDWWGPETGTAVFTVEAVTTSSSLSYLWKWYNDGEWTNSGAAGATTNTIRVGASGDNLTTYRCYITDAEGNVVISDSVTIHTDPVGFIKQPEDCYCSPSGNATFSVEAYGSNLTYQWQWHSPSSETWSNSGATGTNTNAISLGVSGDNGTVYRCMITDANGNVAYSEPATVIPYAINWEYQYNADEMRIYRSNGATTYRYIYNGDQLSQLEITEEATEQKYLLTFSYDANGLPMTVDYDGTVYYYVTNLQGDVIAITDDSGNVKVEYTYDAWGNPLAVSGNMASTLGKHNPLRYRGYVYDAETNLYYLQSRYYDAEIGRFINADNQIAGVSGEVLGYNMFAYCMNNPVNASDSSGNWPRWITAAVTVVAAVVTVAAAITGNFAIAAVAAKVTIAAGAAYIAQSHHFDKRKELNNTETLPKTPEKATKAGWKNSNPPSKQNPNGGGPAADCHQYTSPDKSNVKYVSPDGYREVIYDSAGRMVLDSRDVGTYNLFPSGTFWGDAGHAVFDIFPWVIFGNDDNDPGPVVNKIIRFFE